MTHYRQELLLTFDEHNAGVDVVTMMPDNRRVISASEDQVIKIWDIQNGNEILTFSVPPPFRYLPGFSGLPITPDGQYAITPVSVFNAEKSITENLFVLWNLTTGKEQLTIPIKLEFPIVNATTVTPDGKCVIASAISEKNIHILKIDTGEILSIINVDDNIDELIVTPDGKRLITSSEGGLKIWDLKSGAELLTLRYFCPGMMKQIKFVVEPRGHYLFSIGEVSPDEVDSNNLEVFDLYSEELIASFRGDSPLYSVAVASDGVTTVVGTKSGQVHFLKLKGVENDETSGS